MVLVLCMCDMRSVDNADICAANNMDSPNQILYTLYTTYSFARSVRSLYSDPFSGVQAMGIACPASKRCPFINSGSTCNHALVGKSLLILGTLL